MFVINQQSRSCLCHRRGSLEENLSDLSQAIEKEGHVDKTQLRAVPKPIFFAQPQNIPTRSAIEKTERHLK